jgi:hypothetical protein
MAIAGGPMNRFYKIITFSASLLIVLCFLFIVSESAVENFKKGGAKSNTLFKKEMTIRRLTAEVLKEKIEEGTGVRVESVEITLPTEKKSSRTMTISLKIKKTEISKLLIAKIYNLASLESNIDKNNIAVFDSNKEYLEHE